MAVGFPTKVTYANGDVFSASDINDTNGTINLLQTSTLSRSAGKNCIINGGADIWARGTSIAVAASTNAYTADRWNLVTGATQASTVSRQATSDTTNLPNIQYCMRVQRNLSQTGTSTMYLQTSLETVNSIPQSGKAVTFSFYARAGANFSPTGGTIYPYLVTGTGTDQGLQSGYTGSANAISMTSALTTTWQRFTGTGTLSSSATEMGLQFQWIPTGVAGANDYFEITGVQVELGSYATSFSRSAPNYGGELAACQRYYYRATGGNSGQAIAGSTTAFEGIIPLKVPMRVTPTVLDSSGTRLNDGITTTNTSTLTLNAANSSTESAYLTGTVASGLAQYRTYFFNVSSSSGYYGLSAEL